MAGQGRCSGFVLGAQVGQEAPCIGPALTHAASHTYRSPAIRYASPKAPVGGKSAALGSTPVMCRPAPGAPGGPTITCAKSAGSTLGVINCKAMVGWLWARDPHGYAQALRRGVKAHAVRRRQAYVKQGWAYLPGAGIGAL